MSSRGKKEKKRKKQRNTREQGEESRRQIKREEERFCFSKLISEIEPGLALVSLGASETSRLRGSFKIEDN